jgi:hypothetical protein
MADPTLQSSANSRTPRGVVIASFKAVLKISTPQKGPESWLLSSLLKTIVHRAGTLLFFKVIRYEV